MKKMIIIMVFMLLNTNAWLPEKLEHVPAYTEEVGEEITVNGITVKEHTITAKHNIGERDLPSLNAEIRFPQLYNMENEAAQEKVNKQLKDVVMMFINDLNFDETIKIFDNIVNCDSYRSIYWSGENEYKILYTDEDIISLNIKGEAYSGGANVFFFSDYATIDLSNGELIPFTDYFTKESVIKAIREEKFEWIDGQYTGGYKGNEPEAIDEFIKTAEDLNDNCFDTFTHIFGSIYDFAIDGQYAYITMRFYDSLHGYITLKFDLNDLN